MAAKLSGNLDFLRAVAVLLVLAQHLVRRADAMNLLHLDIPPIGTFGVLLFFVHTCLVLMYSMERSGVEGAALAGNFYIRRVFRVYPLSILAVLTAVALGLDSSLHGVPGLSHAPSVGMGRIASNLFLVQNVVKPGSIINVLWSLPYEVQMYVFLPLLFLWTRRKKFSLWGLCLLWVAFVGFSLARIPLAMAGLSVMRRLSIIDYVPNFLPGIVAFVLPHVPRIKSYLWPPFILLLAAAYAVHPGRPVGWLMCLILGFGIPFFGEIRTKWLRVASHRIAMYSYGIYLSHQFCIWFVADVMSAYPWWSRIAVLIVALVALPVGLYHGIEKPMIDVGMRVAEKWSAKPLIAATVRA